MSKSPRKKRDIPVESNGISVVVLRAVNNRSEVLLLRRRTTMAGEWCQVAGGIKKGETAWEAALREMKEETGLAPERFYSADICEQFYQADKDSIYVAPVFVAFVNPEAAVVLNHEHSEHTWTSFDEADRLLPFAGQRDMIRHIRREFVDRKPAEMLRIRDATARERG